MRQDESHGSNSHQKRLTCIHPSIFRRNHIPRGELIARRCVSAACRAIFLQFTRFAIPPQSPKGVSSTPISFHSPCCAASAVPLIRCPRLRRMSTAKMESTSPLGISSHQPVQRKQPAVDTVRNRCVGPPGPNNTTPQAGVWKRETTALSPRPKRRTSGASP